jgi:RNA methyltransferase, TrmH family
MTCITSIHNPRIKQIRALRSRKERSASGCFYIEGVQLVTAAVAGPAQIELLVIAEALLRSELAWELACRLRATTPHFDVSPDVFRALGEREDAQGIAAVVRQRWLGFDRLDPADDRCRVALEAVQYPGNLGTILRTSDAAGGAGVLLLGNTADPYDPAAVRASTGAIFSQQLVRANVAELAAWARQRDVQIIGATPDAAQDYRVPQYQAPLVLAMGSEGHGLSAELRAACDQLVHIPMAGAADSLNLAIATGLMLYEALRQRSPPVQAGSGR